MQVAVVGDDHPAGAHDGARRGYGIVVDQGVQQACRQAAARGPAHLHRLELLARQHPATDIEDDLPQRVAHGHLGQAAPAHLSGQAEHLGALALLGPYLGVLPAALGDYPGDGRERLDVVDVGGLSPEPRVGGERRSRVRHAALALDRGHQRGLLAADESAGPLLYPDLETPVGPEDILPQEPFLVALVDGRYPAASRQGGTPRGSICSPAGPLSRTPR